MLKAKALYAVNGNAAPESRPLMSVVKSPVSVVATPGKGLHDLIGGMQNIVIESVGSDEKIPEAVGQLAVRMMKSNDLIRDLLYEIRQLYNRGQQDFPCRCPAEAMRRRSRSFPCFRIWQVL